MTAPRTWNEIQSTIAMRRRHDAPIIRRMIDTRDHYNGDVTIPLVNVQNQPEMNVLMPHMVANGIEGLAMRAAGPMPSIHVPALDAMKQTGVKSVEYAARRRRAYYARWHRSHLPLILSRAFRQLIGYGTFGVVVTPDFELGGARIEFRDALGAYPSLRAAEDLREPENVGFVYGRSPDWITATFPEATQMVTAWQRRKPEEQLWDLVEWIDDTQVCIGLLGPRSMYATNLTSPAITGTTPEETGMLLRRWDNRAGMTTAVIPRRVTLDRIAGQMEKIIPMEEWSAKLMALDFVAAERFVFPDMVVIGDEGRTPTIVGGGGWRDGRTGDVNLLQNVKQVQNLQGSPGPMTTQTLDRIERAASISGGVSPYFGGETTGSLRTGRAIDALGGYSVDPRIAEVQLIMQYALETVNRQICAIEKGYFGDQKFTVFSGWPSDRGHVEFVPNTIFESDENAVTYSFPGSDVSQITVAVSQLNGAKLMSRHTARAKHPMIEDADMEDRLIVEEGVDDAMLVAWQQAIAQGQVAWEDVAAYKDLLAAGTPWATAIITVNEAAKQRQAEQAAQQAQQMAAAQQAAGGGQPGLQQGAAAQPGLGGGPQPLPSVPPPGQGTLNVASMVRALHAGTRGPGGPS
jgi:hypothetical protein